MKKEENKEGITEKNRKITSAKKKLKSTKKI